MYGFLFLYLVELVQMTIFEFKTGRKGIISGRNAFWKALLCLVISFFFFYVEVVVHEDDQFISLCQNAGHLVDLPDVTRHQIQYLDGLLHTWPGA